MANSFSKAMDKLLGVSRVDNTTNPDSAQNRLKRKAASQGQPKNFTRFDASVLKNK